MLAPHVWLASPKIIHNFSTRPKPLPSTWAITVDDEVMSPSYSPAIEATPRRVYVLHSMPMRRFGVTHTHATKPQPCIESTSYSPRQAFPPTASACQHPAPPSSLAEAPAISTLTAAGSQLRRQNGSPRRLATGEPSLAWVLVTPCRR